MNQEIIKRIRKTMKANRVTQNELAATLKCTRGAVGHYLSGRRRISIDQMSVIATRLGVEPAWLEYGVEVVGVSEETSVYDVSPRNVPVVGALHEHSYSLVEDVEKMGFPADAFAVKVDDDSLAPRFLPGDCLIVSKGLKVEVGNEVLIIMPDGKARVQRVVKITARQLVAESLMSHQTTFKYKKSDWQALHKIVGVMIRSTGPVSN